MLKSRNFYSGYLIRNSKNYNVPDAEIPCSDTVLSHAISCGAKPKTVSVVLGHSSVAFTLDVYVHPSEKELADCVNFWQFNLVKFLHLDETDGPDKNEEFLLEEIDLHEDEE